MIGDELRRAIQNQQWNHPVFDELNRLERTSKVLKGMQHNFMPGYNKLDHIMHGSSLPSSASTGTKFFRSDLGLLCYYDGTRWLSEERHLHGFEVSVSATFSRWLRIPTGGYSIYIPNKNVVSTSYVATTSDGSNYWTVAISATDSVWANGTTIHSYTTASDTADTWTAHDDTPDSQTPSNGAGIYVLCTKTSSPGALNVAWSLAYRLIIT